MNEPNAAPASDAYERARRNAARLRGFYVHCLVFVLGNAANVAVNAITRGRGGDWWFQWALIAWTVALMAHGITVVGRGLWWGDAWEQRQIDKFLRGDRTPRARRSTPQ